jgi:RNA polymerase sigma factor (sigma-70 family)
MAQGSVVDDQQALEREYLALRSSVFRLLEIHFNGLEDREELYQEVWAEALELKARGKEVGDLGMLLRTMAWRRARDRMRKLSAEPTEPDSHELLDRVDPAPEPDERLARRVDSAIVRDIVESLDPREAAVLKLRYQLELEPEEIQQTLGMSEPLVEKLTTKAYRHVSEVLAEHRLGVTQWSRRQRSLLAAYETGLASETQRERAERLLREDPSARAVLREIRETLHGVAAIIPLPALAVERRGGLPAFWGWLGERLAWVRDQLAAVVDRLGRHSPSVEQAGAGGAASAAGGVVVKAAIVCVAVTGGTVACVTSGVFGGSADDRRHQPPPRLASHSAPVRPPEHVAHLPAAIAPVRHVHHVTRHVVSSRRVAPVAAPPPPSPAPPGSTEFGPGSVGSSGASQTPAAAPSGGGGEFTP